MSPGDGGECEPAKYLPVSCHWLNQRSFYINLPIGGLSLGIILLTLKVPPIAAPATLKEKLLQLDFPGLFVVLGSLVCYLLAMQWGGSQLPWHAPNVIGTLVGWILLAITFCAIEWWSKERASVVPRILKNRVILVCCGYIFLYGSSSKMCCHLLTACPAKMERISSSRITCTYPVFSAWRYVH